MLLIYDVVVIVVYLLCTFSIEMRHLYYEKTFSLS